MLKWLRMLEDFILPPPSYCPLCGENPLTRLECCPKCLADLAIDWRLEKICGRLTAHLFVYQGYGRQIVQQLKFHGGYRAAVAVGALLGRALKETPEFSRVDLLVPVPLHPVRERRRGFNQSQALALGIKSHWHRQIFRGVVRRRETPAQSGLSWQERQANIQRAFAAVGGTDLRGRVCLIVDDVITSGATFHGVAQVLESLGATCLGVCAGRAVLEKGKN